MSSRVSGGVVHTLPMDLRCVLIATAKALAAWEDLTPLARKRVDLLGALAEESSNEDPTHRARAVRAAGRNAVAVVLARVRALKGRGRARFSPLVRELPRQRNGLD